MIAIAVKAMARPMTTRCGIPLISHMWAGDCGYPSNEANVHAEIMNVPRQAASIRYSGQCLRTASNTWRLDMGGRDAGHDQSAEAVFAAGSLAGASLERAPIGSLMSRNCTRSFENTRSRVQSRATRTFFSKRGTLLR